MSNAAAFQLSTVPGPPDRTGARVIEVLGEVDVTNAAQLQHELTQLAPGGLIVDLTRAGYFDSAGLAVLDRLLARQPIAIVAAPASILRAALTLLHLPFHDSADAARASLPGA
jgi:anti-anti-sigma factor